MIEISRFYGILIKMFCQSEKLEEGLILALYGERVGIFNVYTMESKGGDLPRRCEGLVKEWLSLHQEELEGMCRMQIFRELTPLE